MKTQVWAWQEKEGATGFEGYQVEVMMFDDNSNLCGCEAIGMFATKEESEKAGDEKASKTFGIGNYSKKPFWGRLVYEQKN